MPTSDGDDEAAMAGAVHDGPLQLLVAAMQELEDPGDGGRERGRALVGDAIAALRDLLAGADGLLPGPELADRLESWCGQLRDQHAPSLHVVVSVERPVTRLVHDAARELISNAARHAGATRIVGHVSSDGRQGVTVRVVDDGVGMPPGRPDGFGLHVLRRRIELAGGWLRHRPLAQGGTTAELHLPDAGAHRPAGSRSSDRLRAHISSSLLRRSSRTSAGRR